MFRSSEYTFVSWRSNIMEIYNILHIFAQFSKQICFLWFATITRTQIKFQTFFIDNSCLFSSFPGSGNYLYLVCWHGFEYSWYMTGGVVQYCSSFMQFNVIPWFIIMYNLPKLSFFLMLNNVPSMCTFYFTYSSLSELSASFHPLIMVKNVSMHRYIHLYRYMIEYAKV